MPSPTISSTIPTKLTSTPTPTSTQVLRPTVSTRNHSQKKLLAASRSFYTASTCPVFHNLDPFIVTPHLPPLQGRREQAPHKTPQDRRRSQQAEIRHPRCPGDQGLPDRPDGMEERKYRDQLDDAADYGQWMSEAGFGKVDGGNGILIGLIMI
jgi:hypothetical protein